MGVSLSLDGTQQARSRRRGGQHSRTAEEQACLDALAALLHADAALASRCLSKVSSLGLASRLVPAAQALARAADLELSSDASAARPVDADFVLSPACLLGLCDGVAGASICRSPACQHTCHAPAGTTGTVSAGTALTDTGSAGTGLSGTGLAGTELSGIGSAGTGLSGTGSAGTGLTGPGRGSGRSP
jgi:hypothetical protein